MRERAKLIAMAVILAALSTCTQRPDNDSDSAFPLYREALDLMAQGRVDQALANMREAGLKGKFAPPDDFPLTMSDGQLIAAANRCDAATVSENLRQIQAAGNLMSAMCEDCQAHAMAGEISNALRCYRSVIRFAECCLSLRASVQFQMLCLAWQEHALRETKKLRLAQNAREAEIRSIDARLACVASKRRTLKARALKLRAWPRLRIVRLRELAQVTRTSVAFWIPFIFVAGAVPVYAAIVTVKDVRRNPNRTAEARKGTAYSWVSILLSIVCLATLGLHFSAHGRLPPLLSLYRYITAFVALSAFTFCVSAWIRVSLAMRVISTGLALLAVVGVLTAT